jgi:hypothetical protein
MFKADGWETDGRKCFAQYTPEGQVVMDVFQILSILTGRTADVLSSSSPSARFRLSCTVSDREIINPSRAGGVQRKNYVGEVWCPETPSGTWVMRHKGSVVFTGNTTPGLPKRLALYNYDQARKYNCVVIVEGPADVWAVGPQAVAMFGSDLSMVQRELLYAWKRNGVVVVLLDGDAFDHARQYAAEMNGPFGGRVVLVELPDGTDPGDYSRRALWELIYATADKQKIQLRKGLRHASSDGRR